MSDQNLLPSWVTKPAVLQTFPFTVDDNENVLIGWYYATDGILLYRLPFFILSCDVTDEYHPSILNAVPLMEAFRGI